MTCEFRCNRRLTYSTKIRVIFTIFVVFLFAVLIKDSILHSFSRRDPVDAERALSWDGDPIEEGGPRWQKLDNFSQAFVYAAHYDDVESSPLIRVIGVALDPLPYFYVTCRYFGRRDGPVTNTVTGKILHLRDRNGRRYLAAYVECPLDKYDNSLPYALTVDKGNNFEGLNYMVIHYSQDANRPRSSVGVQTEGSSFTRQSSVSQPHSPWNVTRCFPAFQMGFNDHEMLAEMVAISRMLGVQHFVFYVQSAGPRVLAMLKVLEEEGDTEVHPWNIYLEEADFYYAGQFSSINDCMYRHLRTSRYLLFGDVDELFVPRHQPSLVELLDQEFTQNPECGAFLFLNVFFNLNLPTTSIPTTENQTALTHLRHLTMLTHTQRHTEVLQPGDRSKPAVDPRKVLTCSVHVIQTLRHGFQACDMQSDKGLLHHYRMYDVPPEDERVNDPFLWWWFDDIVRETRTIMDEYDEMVE